MRGSPPDLFLQSAAPLISPTQKLAVPSSWARRPSLSPSAGHCPAAEQCPYVPCPRTGPRPAGLEQNQPDEGFRAPLGSRAPAREPPVPSRGNTALLPPRPSRARPPGNPGPRGPRHAARAPLDVPRGPSPGTERVPALRAECRLAFPVHASPAARHLPRHATSPRRAPRKVPVSRCVPPSARRPRLARRARGGQEAPAPRPGSPLDARRAAAAGRCLARRHA